jgi:tetratricopeptide (TPR) repeat protein
VKGDWDEAIARFEEIVSLSNPQNDQRVLAEAYRRIGVVYIRRYNYDKAEERLATSLQLAGQLSDRRLLVEAYYDLGGVLRSRGRYLEALDYFVKSRDLASQSFDDAGMGKALYGMGQVYSSLMDHEKAIQCKKEGLGYIERTGDVDDITRVLIGLGGSLADLAKFAEAARYEEKAIEMGRISGNLELQGYAFRNASNIMLELDELDQAEEYLNSAMKIFEKLNNRFNLADLHMIRGGIYNKRMEWEWAKEEFQTAIEMVRKINAPLILGSMLYEIAQEYLKGGDQEGASVLLKEALSISTEESLPILRDKVEETIAKIGI